jgi:hypothetical protein
MSSKAKSISRDNPFKVRLVVGSEPRESWEQLSLEYVVPWPLHLLITPKALANYNKVRNAVLNSNPKSSVVEPAPSVVEPEPEP